MPDPAHGHCPGLEGEDGINTHSQYLGIHFIKLRQRTVERGGLIGSAAGEGERKGVQDDPFVAELPERDFLAIVALQFEIGRCGPSI